jgi:hypothetical protein
MTPVLALLLLPDVLAQLPLPTYPQCGEPDRPDLCPPDLRESWWQISYVPAGSRDSVRPAELATGSGNRNDRAWRVTTGDWQVMLAVADSGIHWNERDYRNKIALNAEELPVPQHADGTDVAGSDLDGNGIFNIQDWAEDPRVDPAAGHPSASDALDPSDLLAAFSDGVDDDGNGLVDDIAGWDFFSDDNDPYASFEGDFGDHGSGVVEDMAAEGGDDGAIGVCPNCAVLPIRIGDTFVTDGSRAAMALLYAAERGAAAFNLSVGALTNPATMTEAAAWARANGISIAGAAGDENAYHANFPALHDGVLFVHSIRADSSDENTGAYSYFNFFNCNNYGPRLDVVADSPACATGATAITTGAVGLVKSAARARGITLESDEVYQLLVTTATDIALPPEDVATANTYPSAEGWDTFYGYGRLDIGRAVDAVAAGRIPPMLDLTSPGWLETRDPARGPVDIVGTIRMPRAQSVDYVVDVGVGATPTSWRELTRGTVTADFAGTFAQLDLSTLDTRAPGDAPAYETLVQRVTRVMGGAVTVRVRATDSDGSAASFRKTFFVRHDPDLLEAFPLTLPGSAESSPVLADLDDDGIFEIVIADATGWVHAFDAQGREAAGFPVRTALSRLWRPQLALPGVSELHEAVLATAAVGDLEGDGLPEVVAAGVEGRVYAWHADGSPVDGFPVAILGRPPERVGSENGWDNGIYGAPTLYDLDGDGSLEVLAAGLDQRLYAWDAAGQPWGPYPVELCDPSICGVEGARIINSPTVGDVDGDGAVEIGLGTNETVSGGRESISYLLDAVSGTLEPGWPLREGGLINEAGLLPIVGDGHPGSLAFADLDRDGDLEIASPVMLGRSPLYHHDATVARDLSYVMGAYGPESNATEPSFVQMTNNPSFGDLTGDGVPDYVIGGAGTYYLVALALPTALEWHNVVAAWDGATGQMLPGWPRQVEDLQFLVAPGVADVTGDGRAEAIMGSAGYLLHAWDARGNEAEGWPKFTGNWILGSPATGDIDGDGYVEVVISTREGRLFAWRTRGRADQDIGWAGVHHDPQNTGNASTPLARQAGPADVEGAGGCCGRDGEEASAWMLLPLGLLARRRRRG